MVRVLKDNMVSLSKTISLNRLRATQKLQLVHTNIGRPQTVLSLNDSVYYITFIADYTRYCWIYFFQSTIEVAIIC